MTRNGRAFVHRIWAPATAGIDGGASPIGPSETPGLPTPAACVANDGERPETWLARRERVKAKWINGNGMGMPLTIAVQLLPTSRANSAMTCALRGQADKPNPNLETVLGRMLPTPTTRDWKDGSQQACAGVAANGLLGQEIHQQAGSPLTGDPMYLNPAFALEMMGYPVDWLS